jgi:hypothetical protein
MGGGGGASEVGTEATRCGPGAEGGSRAGPCSVQGRELCESVDWKEAWVYMGGCLVDRDQGQMARVPARSCGVKVWSTRSMLCFRRGGGGKIWEREMRSVGQLQSQLRSCLVGYFSFFLLILHRQKT